MKILYTSSMIMYYNLIYKQNKHACFLYVKDSIENNITNIQNYKNDYFIKLNRKYITQKTKYMIITRLNSE